MTLCSYRPYVLALAAILPNVVFAAEVTDMAPRNRADVHARYSGSFEQAGIEEDRTIYGIRNELSHDLALRGEVGVWQGLGVTIGLPIRAQYRLWFPAAREMLYEPLEQSGSYAAGQPIEVEELRATGVQGVWLGVMLAPFREEFNRGLPVTTRFDIAVRTPAPGDTIYGENRGVAPGGAAFQLSGAFSVIRGTANPYATLDFLYEGAANVPVLALDGTDQGELRLRPGTQFDAIGGVELLAHDNPTTQSRFAVDLHAGFGFRGDADRPSGFYLPSVLPESRGTVATRSGYVVFTGGIALDAHLNPYVGLRLGADMHYATPRAIEHAYAATTDPQTYKVTWHAGLVGRIRTKQDLEVVTEAEAEAAEDRERIDERF